MSHEVTPQFYSAFPARGVTLARQVGAWQDNSLATGPLVNASFVDPNTGGSRVYDALAYLSSGRKFNRYRFRSGYNQHTSAYQIQVNLGTDASQNWQTYFSIDEASGHVTAPFGVNNDFYGLRIRESSPGGTRYTTRDLIVDSNFFYLDSGGGGVPILSFLGTGGGEVNTASNIGAGTGLFAQKVSFDLQFKSLVAGSNISITSDADEVFIASQAGGGFYGINVGLDNGTSSYRQIVGLKLDDKYFYLSQNGLNNDEVHIGFREDKISNVGSGTGLFAQKVERDFQLKSLTAGSNITLTPSADSVEISASGGGSSFYGVLFKESEAGGYSKRAEALIFDSAFFYLSTDGDGRPLVSLNSSTGSAVQSFTSSREWQFTHNLSSSNLLWAVYDDRDEAVIPYRVDVSNPNTAFFYFSSLEAGRAILSTGGSGGGSVSATNIGAGTGLFAQTVSGSLQFKSLVAGSNISITSDADEAFIAANIDKFYGITVKNSNNSERYKGINVIAVDNTFFYLEQNNPNTDEVLLSFKPQAVPISLSVTDNRTTFNSVSNIIFNRNDFYLTYGAQGRPQVNSLPRPSWMATGCLVNIAGTATQNVHFGDVLNLDGFVMFRAGKVLGMSVCLNIPKTGGTLTITLSKDGVAQAETIVLPTGTRFSSVEFLTPITYTPGNVLEMSCTTSSYTPANAEATVLMFLQDL